MNTEQIVAKADDLSDGQMKELEVRGRTILLLRVDGEYKAYVSECPHHGAPLAEGLLHEGRIRCPWHQAVFDARNGDLVEPPALDRLPHYEVRVEGDDVIVVLPSEQPSGIRPPAMAGGGEEDDRTFAIIGGGAAGLAAAETLRQEGFRGRVVVLTREQDISYDRTELSKRYLADSEQASPVIRPDKFFIDHDIEVRTGREVTEADVESATISCGEGEPLKFDTLLIATGGLPRTLGVDGEELDGVFTLRSLADCRAIRSAANSASSAVVVGASFIGMETAAALSQRGLKVTIVAPESAPFEQTLGEGIGTMYRKVHEKEGTEFRLGGGVERFEGQEGAVQYALLSSGERLKADLVIVGIGVRPATDFLKGMQTNEDGSISVDANMKAAENVFAAGDVARWPDWRNGAPIRIEHWRLAQQLGRTAARGMLGKDAPYLGVPFFWTSQHKLITEYVGHTAGWKDIVFDGSPAEQDFLAYYVTDGRVHAVAGCGRSWEMAAVAEVLKGAQHPTVDELRERLEQMRRPQPA